MRYGSEWEMSEVTAYSSVVRGEQIGFIWNEKISKRCTKGVFYVEVAEYIF